MKGIFDIKKYKAEQVNGEWQPISEPIEHINQENAIFHRAMDEFLNNSQGLINLDNTGSEVRIFISEYNGPLNEAANADDEKLNFISGFSPVGQDPSSFEINNDEEIIATLRARFNPPGSGTRQVGSIFVRQDDGPTTFNTACGISLTNSCEQEDDELLDISYRFIINVNNLNEINSNVNMYNFLRVMYSRTVRDAGNVSFGEDTLKHNTLWFCNKIIHGNKFPFRSGFPILYESNSLFGSNTQGDFAEYGYSGTTRYAHFNISSIYEDYEHRTQKLNCQEMNENQYVGRIFSKNIIFPQDSTSFSNIIFSHPIVMIDYIPEDASKNQNIFLHAPNAETPYLDINYLGTGTGLIELDTQNYPTDLPRFFKVELSTDGNVGETEYKFKTRYQFGFEGNDYYKEGVLPIFTLIKSSETIPIDMHHLKDGSTPENVYFYTKFYDDETFIVGDYTGLTFVDLKTFDRFNIDANSSSVLDVDKINNFAISDTGEVYIAASNDGLFVLSNDQSTVTKIEPTPETDVNFDACYYVALKNNGDIWAAFDGALAKSTDGGTNWTIYNPDTSPAFEYTGITNGNWDNIVGLILDKSSDRMAIYSKLDNLIWWAPGDSTVQFYSHGSLVYSQNLPMLNEKQCYHIPGTDYWAHKTTSITIRTIEYGETSALASRNYQASSTSVSSYLNYRFYIEQDSNGNWSILAPERGNYGTQWTIRDINFNLLHALNPNPAGTSTGDDNLFKKNVVIDYYGKGLGLIYNNSVTFGPLFNIDELDGTDIEYLIWDDYGWNGSSWELGNENYKTTHGSFEELLSGADIRFMDGDTGTTAFVDGEYFTTYISPGVVKDNATRLNYSFYNPSFRAGEKIEDFTPSIVPTSSGYDLENKYLNFHLPLSLRDSSQVPDSGHGRHLSFKGKFGRSGHSSSSFGRPDYVLKSEFIFEGDFEVQTEVGLLGPSTNTGYYFFLGLGDTTKPSPTGGSTGVFAGPYFRIRTNDIVFFESGGSSIGSTHTVNDGDIVSVQRSSGIVSFKINDSVVETSTVSYTDDCRITIFENMQFLILNECKVVSGTDPRTFVELGDANNQTGIYEQKFAFIEHFINPPTINILLNGVEVPVSYDDPYVTPSEGQVTLLSRSGLLCLSSDDGNKTISGSCIVLKEDDI